MTILGQNCSKMHVFEAARRSNVNFVGPLGFIGSFLGPVLGTFWPWLEPYG